MYPCISEPKTKVPADKEAFTNYYQTWESEKKIIFSNFLSLKKHTLR